MKTTGKEKFESGKLGFIAKWYWGAIAFLLPQLSHAATDFKTGLSYALGIAAGIGFVSCCWFIIEGVYNYRRGGEYGKDIIAVIVCAGAIALCGAIYAAFGLGSAVIEPTF